ncbi:MAG: DNA methyltransferase [Pseudomonadota bacterium]
MTISKPLLPNTTQPVKCLTLTFKNDEARRAHFLEQLREKLQNPEFRKISGFPHATDEAILALSDPPYYTACPNPWLSEFWATTPSDAYHREPFAADISEGKNDPIYNAHAYHTKVPHKAIMRYILHYTQPGDIVFDSFCGTGMTGVAAQMCGDRRAVEALAYRVLDDGTILRQDENQFKPFSKLGKRRAILNDLSPAATFIASNYNTPVDVIAFEHEALQILQNVEAELGWMYQTLHRCTKNTKEYAQDIKKIVLGEMDCPTWINLGRINYTVWSDVFICPECAGELIFWETAVDKVTGKINKKFPCPHCDATLTKRKLERAWVLRFDKAIAETIRQAKQVPVLINYSMDQQRYQKTPDIFDLALLEKIENSEIPYWFPTVRMMAGDESRRNDRLGITHVHHFYTKRSLWTLSALIQQADSNPLRHLCRFLFQQWAIGFSKLNRYSPTHFSQNNRNLSGTLYIGSQTAEVSPSYAFSTKLKRLKTAFANNRWASALISTQSATDFKISDSSIDYIFLDPPFGANLMYSELNFLWEAWHKVFTNTVPETIVNKTQGKKLSEYRTLMVKCFAEAFRILKPGRWMTVEFSNTQARVWNTLQTALQEAGFIIANVSALDKKQGSFKAVTTSTAVKQDLIISAYKPNGGLEERFKKAAGTEAGVWEFLHSHLKNLPLPKSQAGELCFIAERTPRILYDRTVAYFIGHGYPVPLSSQQFQAGLGAHFAEKDGMIFRLDEIEAYEQKRKQAKQLPQMELFVSDERSAIDWLQHFIKKRPSTRQEIHPELTKLIGAGWKKYEMLPELDALLEFHFLKYNGKGEVPSQIHGYLSRHFKDCRNLAKNDPLLQQRAAERWYVPDPNKALDLEKIRENHLLREFKHYRQSPKKHLKEFRLEAMRAGFKKAWGQKDYQTIIEMAAKIPEAVLYEDEKLLQLYDLAVIRLEGV